MLSPMQGIREAAERNPFAPALVTAFRIVSFGDLLAAVTRISNHLADRGVRQGSKAFFNIADADIRFIVTIACLHYGIVPFVMAEIGDLADEVDYDVVIATLPLKDAGLKPDIILDNALFAAGPAESPLREFPPRGDGEVLFVATTTGTTGRRKLLAELVGSSRARGILGGTRPSATARRIGIGDRSLSTLGTLTRYGFGISLHNLAQGAADIRAPTDNLECLKAINVMGVTHLSATPDTMNAFMDLMEDIHARCPSVVNIRLSGSLFHPALIERLERNFSAEVMVAYGTSEVGRISAGVATAATFAAGYVGEPHPEVRIVSAGTPGNPQPVVIVNDGAQYTPFYSKGRLIPVPATSYALSDLGYMKDGSLYLVGRDDEVFNADGNKVAYSVIENALRALPGVRDVGVVSGAAAGDPLGVLVAVTGKAKLDTAELTNKLVQAVQSSSARRHIHVFQLEAMPRNDFGKVDRKGVAAAYLSQAGAGSAG